MRGETVARNYAETLFDLARRHQRLGAFEEGIAVVATLLDENPDIRLFLETPRIADEDKKEVVRSAFEDALPQPLLSFLLITIDKRRQRLLRDIAREFRSLADEHEGRTHVEVTLAREPDGDAVAEVGRRLSAMLDTDAIPHVRVDPRILGGVVIRTGDTIYDGSLRRRLEGMRRRMQQVALPDVGELDPEGS